MKRSIRTRAFSLLLVILLILPVSLFTLSPRTGAAGSIAVGDRVWFRGGYLYTSIYGENPTGPFGARWVNISIINFGGGRNINYHIASPAGWTDNANLIKPEVTFLDWNNAVLKTQAVSDQVYASAPANPSRTGYNFTGWSPPNYARELTDDLTVRAQYTIKTYTVRFMDWDNTVLKTQMVNHGASASAPTDPSRTGYTYVGWDTSFSNITGALTVRALYEINYYDVTFIDWDGTVLSKQSIVYGAAATAPYTPARIGYTFTGWDIYFTNVQSNLTVRAQYIINTYTVTFLGWNGTLLSTQEIEHGSPAEAPAAPVRNGHVFTGWDIDFSNITGDLVVTALYVPYLGLAAENNAVTLTASLISAADLPASADAQIILVVYDANGKMLSFTFAEVSFGGTLVVEKLSALLPAGAIVKGFLWDADSIPLIGAAELKT